MQRSFPTRASLAAALALAAATVPAPAPAAAFHLHLTRSEPAADSTITAAPAELRLWFSQAPELRVTSVRLTGEGDRAVTVGSLTRARGANMPVVAPITGTLDAGRHTVAWRTMSRDGHPVSGTFAFTYAPGTPAHDH